MSQRIFVLEKDWVESEAICAKLNHAFPDFVINRFMDLADFLIRFPSMASEARIIITEDRLALMEPREDYKEAKAGLERDFPEFGSEWKARHAPKALLKYLSTRQLDIPVIIYTHSNMEWIDTDLISNPQVAYLEKEVDFEPLVNLVQATLARTLSK